MCMITVVGGCGEKEKLTGREFFFLTVMIQRIEETLCECYL